MADKNEGFLLDTRIVKRNIQQGRIDRKFYEAHLQSLKDLSDQCFDIGEKIYADDKTKVSVAGDFVKEDKDYE